MTNAPSRSQSVAEETRALAGPLTRIHRRGEDKLSIRRAWRLAARAAGWAKEANAFGRLIERNLTDEREEEA